MILALQCLRNQLTVYPHEVPISSNDARLVLVQDWLTESPGATEVFDVWDSSQVGNFAFSLLPYRSNVMLQNSSISSLCISTLAALLTLLSQHFIYHSRADEIIRRILDHNVMRRLNSCLGTVQYETMIATLKLFNALVDFADGREKRSVLDNFAWSMKVCWYCQ